jgi:hypothetical protein
VNSTPFSAGFPIVHPAKSSLAFSVPGPLQKRAHCRLQRTEGRQSRKPRAKQPRAPGRGGSNVEPQEAGTTFPSSWSLSHSSFLGLPETRWEHLHCSSLTVTSRALSMPRGGQLVTAVPVLLWISLRRNSRPCDFTPNATSSLHSYLRNLSTFFLPFCPLSPLDSPW